MNQRKVWYKCSYTLDRRMYFQWGAESRTRASVRVKTALWGVFAGGCLLLGIHNRNSVLLLLYFVFFTLFGMYRGFLRWRVAASRQYSLLAKQYGGENWVRTVSFETDRIVLEEGNFRADYPYEDVLGVTERNGYIRIFLRGDTVLRLYGDRFVRGTWEDCRKWLDGRTAREGRQ